jgi:hypothetical protein
MVDALGGRFVRRAAEQEQVPVPWAWGTLYGARTAKPKRHLVSGRAFESARPDTGRCEFAPISSLRES